jgi:hypothetical protein
VTYPAYTDSTSGVGARAQALELLAEMRGISVELLDSAEAIRAAIQGLESRVFRVFHPSSSLPGDPVAAFAALSSPLES